MKQVGQDNPSTFLLADGEEINNHPNGFKVLIKTNGGGFGGETKEEKEAAEFAFWTQQFEKVIGARILNAHFTCDINLVSIRHLDVPNKIVCIDMNSLFK